MFVEDLKVSVLQEAIQGKLTKQLKYDSSAVELLQSIISDKKVLERKSKIRKQKNLNPIEEDFEINIPDNWTFERLGNIFEIIRGSSPRPKGSPEYWSSSKTKYNWITINDITNYCTNGYLTETKEFLTEAGSELSTYVKKDELIIAVSGSTTGKSCLLGIDGYIYDGLAAIINCKKKRKKRYLFCLMKHYYNVLNSEKVGTSFPNINTDMLKEVVIPIPPIEEQQRIVDRLDEILPEIDELAKIEKDIIKLKNEFPVDFKNSILQSAMQGKLTEQLEIDSSVEILIDYIKNNYNRNINEVKNDTNFAFPQKWKFLKLVDATNMYTGNSISESIKKTKYTNLKQGYNYIGTKDIGFDHSINYNNGVKIPFNESKFKYADKDATLLCIEGGSAGRKIAILDEKVCFGNKLCAFHPLGINKKYLYYFLQSPIFLNSFMDKMSGIIGGVSINKIKQVIIPIPPVEEQQRIVEKLNQLLPLCDGLIEK